MRKKEKEITDHGELEAIIRKSSVCRLGMVDKGIPYIVPLSFGYHNNALFLHGAKKGRKIDMITANPNVCFEFDHIMGTVKSEKACNWSMKFQSIIGYGTASFLQSKEEKKNALTVIMAQYSDKEFTFPDTMLEATAVIQLSIESMTGKQSLPEQ